MDNSVSGALIEETVWLGDIPVATLRPNGATPAVYYVHADHLNTPRIVTQPADNAVRWRWDSDPFGTNAPNENPSGLGVFKYNLRFPGQQYDGVAGLSYNYFRDYDPATGRYVESDPIGLRGGSNTYSYVNAKALSFADPMGLAPCYLMGTRYGPWAEVPGTREKPWYELIQVLASDVTGNIASCVYQRLQWLREQRDVYLVYRCWNCKFEGCQNPMCRWESSEQRQPRREIRWHKDVSTKIGSGVALNMGGAFDPTSPSNALCVNPWTGNQDIVEFGPGP